MNELAVDTQGYLHVLDAEPNLVCSAIFNEERRPELRAKAVAALREEP